MSRTQVMIVRQSSGPAASRSSVVVSDGGKGNGGVEGQKEGGST